MYCSLNHVKKEYHYCPYPWNLDADIISECCKMVVKDIKGFDMSKPSSPLLHSIEIYENNTSFFGVYLVWHIVFHKLLNRSHCYMEQSNKHSYASSESY